MAGQTHISITPGCAVPLSEIVFRFSRSGGPGGQNVNRVRTRVELLFDVSAATSLSAEQKRRIQRALATRISKAGVLRVVSSRARTQAGNIRLAREHFRSLLAKALAPRKRRIPTRPGKSAVRKRLAAKQRTSRKKELRARVCADDSDG